MRLCSGSSGGVVRGGKTKPVWVKMVRCLKTESDRGGVCRVRRVIFSCLWSSEKVVSLCHGAMVKGRWLLIGLHNLLEFLNYNYHMLIAKTNWVIPDTTRGKDK